MASINSHFTFNYSQPEEYRLSHDSVFLAREIFERMRGEDLTGKRGLDICAGSGVVGMDFLFHRRAAGQSLPVSFDFLEVQEVYSGHFVANASQLGPIETRLNFLCCNYNILTEAKFAEAFDLVVCNPPYFLPGRGKLSPNEFKNRCRFFIDSDLRSLLAGVHNCLKPFGVCYMTLRELKEHGLDILAEAREFSKNKLLIEVAGEIRGTLFLRMTKVDFNSFIPPKGLS